MGFNQRFLRGGPQLLSASQARTFRTASNLHALLEDLMTAVSFSRSLTIGFLRRGYSSSGGVEVYLKGLAAGLRAQGHRVILLGTGEWPSWEWPGGEMLKCAGKNLTVFAAEVERQKSESGIPFDLILSVEKVPGCDLYRTDEGIHLAWLKEREPYLHPWARLFQKFNPKHREKLRMERALFRSGSTRRVISISEKITRDLVDLYGYPADRISLIRNGVPQVGVANPEQRAEARKALGISLDEKIILFVGTGWERKGLRFAIQAVEGLALDHPTVRLLVAGKGAVHRYASPAVTFLGPVTHMKRVYAAADLFVTPTIFEPFSLAALEALSAGLPVITSKAAGISEIMIPGVHGEIIDSPSDREALRAALAAWLSILEEGQRSSVQKNCADLASEFTLERNLRETMTLIHDLIREKARG